MPKRKEEPRVRTLEEAADIKLAENTAVEALLKSLKPIKGEVIRPKYDPEAVAREAEEMGGSLRKFIPAAWGIIEPNKFVPNWHIDAIADHLEAVSKGYILDLLITMPPRHSKSLLVSVLWPVWEWITQPYYRWMFASYAFNLSVRDSVKRRNIIKHDWYQERWADKFSIVPDQDTKIKYENDKHGFMMASSVGGSNTGEGGERIVADDPHNIKKVESPEVRQDTVDWWNIVMSTRRNDTERSARVVVQQRTNEGDVAGDIIERGGYVHLNLPTEFGFAGAVRCKTSWTIKETGKMAYWEDPRQTEGELLNPQRFDAEANEKAKATLGDYQYAAQHGQNPTPPKGQIIQAQWIKRYGNVTKGQPPIPDWTKCTHPMMPLFSLDCAFKEHKDTDFVAGLGFAMFGADVYVLPVCVHRRMNFPDTIDAVAEFVGGESLDKSKQFPGIFPFMKIKLVESKANGPAVIDTLRHRIPGMVGFEPGGASKESRLSSASWRFRAGNVYLPDESIAPWVAECIYELCAFPKARHDDFVDVVSQALLFIGGDPQTVMEPAGEYRKSNWHGVGDNDEGGTPSIWGNVSDTGFRSVWRQ